MGFFKKLKERLFNKKENDSTESNSLASKENEENQNEIIQPLENNQQFNNELELEENKTKNSKINQKSKQKKATIKTKKSLDKNEPPTNPSKDDEKEITKEEKRLQKKQEKLIKKEEKQRRKQLSKENKINKYVAGLSKSSSNLTQKIIQLQTAHNSIDESFFEELEEILIMSDISISMVNLIIDEIKKEVKMENITDKSLISEIIADKMFAIYANQSTVDTKLNLDNPGLNVLLIVGVNGSGKTTSIAKIANKLVNEGKKVLLAACDTFRAGAVEQLKIWANRLNVDIVLPDKEGADPASVVYKALEQTHSNNYDVLIVDTAGRLQNKVNLMNELAKINKIIEKFINQKPHESLLVLDATTGQNGVIQAQAFKEVTPLTGIVLTKMDGTSNGGIILTIKDKLDLDVKLIGLGERMDDLEEFDLDSYIYGLMKGLMTDEDR